MREETKTFAEELADLYDIPEDGGDLAEIEAKEEGFKSQFDLGPGAEEDESFHAITTADEPLPFQERPSTIELIGSVQSYADTIESVSGSQYRTLTDVSTDGFSRNTGLVTQIAVFGSAKTTRDRGWDLTLHLPETVKGEDIDQIRDGGLRVIIIPENIASQVISEAVDQVIDALISIKADK